MKKAVGVGAGLLATVGGMGALVLMVGGAGGAGAAVPSGGAGILNASAVPEAYRGAVIAAGARCPGVSGPVLAAQIQAESGWAPSAGSPAGASGIAQFMPATWQSWGKDYSGDGVADVLNPTDAIGSQADFMCYLRGWVDAKLAAGVLKGDPLQLTLAAYNAGPGAVELAGGIPSFAETQQYVQRILSFIPTYTTTPQITGAPGGTSGAGGGPAVSADGTSRVPMAGSGRLDISTLCRIPWAGATQVLRCDAEQSLEVLNAAYRAQFGVDLGISSAYRDYATQIVLKAQKGRIAATPGTSNHGWGLAVDFGAVDYAWLAANSRTYGWDHPSWARPGGALPEAWHWEFVGIS
jgi:Transglycosylase SLT domain/D-alanyl-D-alanine carboxypeptidase